MGCSCFVNFRNITLITKYIQGKQLLSLICLICCPLFESKLCINVILFFFTISRSQYLFIFIYFFFHVSLDIFWFLILVKLFLKSNYLRAFTAILFLLLQQNNDLVSKLQITYIYIRNKHLEHFQQCKPIDLQK